MFAIEYPLFWRSKFLYFKQIFGHWKTLLLFLFRLYARLGFSQKGNRFSSPHISKTMAKHKIPSFFTKKSLTNSMFVSIKCWLVAIKQRRFYWLKKQIDTVCRSFSPCVTKRIQLFCSLCLYNHFHSIYFLFRLYWACCVWVCVLLFDSLILCNHKRFSTIRFTATLLICFFFLFLVLTNFFTKNCFFLIPSVLSYHKNFQFFYFLKV